MSDLNQMIAAVSLVKQELIVLDTALVGSTYICGKGADIDLLVRVPNLVRSATRLAELGWTPDGNPGYEANGFVSLRKGDVNVLLCEDKGFFDKTTLAAEVCKALKLSVKQDRIAVHRVIRDGMKADDFDLWR